MDTVATRRALLRWYARKARDLPWRRTRDPYAIWVSEIMLQQTRVDVAKPYFLRWMKRFPTMSVLAAASSDDVMAAWSGLGYYRRAKSLHAAARQVVEECGGKLPRSSQELVPLPGFGPYTSAAVASIAFGEATAAIDGNVVRVIARLAAIRGDARRPANKRRITKIAQELVDVHHPGEWNQAVMDLGATVCVPRNPRCAECPVARQCVAKQRGIQAQIPAVQRKAIPSRHAMAFAVVERGGEILVVRNPAEGLLAGLWSLPGGSAARPLPALVARQTGVRVKAERNGQRVQSSFTHRTWDMRVRRARIVGSSTPGAAAKWVSRNELDGLALSSAMRRAITAVTGETS